LARKNAQNQVFSRVTLKTGNLGLKVKDFVAWGVLNVFCSQNLRDIFELHRMKSFFVLRFSFEVGASLRGKGRFKTSMEPLVGVQ